MNAKRHIIIFALLNAILMIISSVYAAPQQKTTDIPYPDGLISAEWESIQAQIAATEQQFTPKESMPTPLTAIPLLQQQKLIASDAAADNRFGYSVAVDGDTVIVGVPYNDEKGEDSGAAYVFVRSEGTWSQQQKLTASDAEMFTGFGRSVAISGDTVVIGAFFGGDSVGFLSGAAYVFTRLAGVWTQQQTLVASGADAYEGFSASVAVLGDTAIIGAPGDDDSGNNSGAAYVFVRSAGVWTQQQKLIASDAAATDFFGASVAISGDTTVIGADGDDDFSGAAYVFVRSAGVWSQQQKLTASDAMADDYFGSSVAVDGDTVVIGARYEINSSHNTGAAYVFVRSSGVWDQQQKLTSGSGYDYFGVSVAVSGDTAVIGAYRESNYKGAAYVFIRLAGVWNQRQKLTSNDANWDDKFGWPVAVDGDTVIVGVRYDDDNSVDSGSAYIFTVATHTVFLPVIMTNS